MHFAKLFLVVAFVISLGLGGLVAQEATATDLQVMESEDWGAYVADAQGNALYLYIEDEGAEGSTCVDACTSNWPPLPADGDVTVGEGVDAALVDTTARSDGGEQVTYGGWPLYQFARDAQPGDTRGQSLGGAFFLVSPQGEPITEQVATDDQPVDEELMTALMAEGEPIFRNICSSCHGNEGQGVVGPALDGMAALERDGFLINRILYGRPEHGMPAFGDRFSDREVAAVATFVKNSWSNSFGIVTEEEVVEGR